MPTGVHLRDARELLFASAERVVAREGAGGLTSRAVTDEAGVAKGVMHRHFVDFDGFLAELILDRAERLGGPASRLLVAAGRGSVVDNLCEALTVVFSPLAVAVLALVVVRDGLRARLREAGAPSLPLLSEGVAMVAAYLTAEQAAGRLRESADVPSLSPALVGSVHLLCTDQGSHPPDRCALRGVVASVVQGALEERGRGRTLKPGEGPAEG